NVETVTVAGEIAGSLGHMPFEQVVNAATVDPRADIYAVGSLLYHMLTGLPPHLDPARLPALVRREDRILRLEEIDRATPPAVSALVARAMERDPDRRFADASELLQAIAAAQSGAAGAALPSPRVSQAAAAVAAPFGSSAIVGEDSGAPSVPSFI